MLVSAQAAGTTAASFHPLVAFADVDGSVAALRGATVALEGDESLLGILSDLAWDIGAQPVRLPPGGKAAYHAAAVLAAGGFIGLLDAIAELGRGAGLDERGSLAIYGPLIRQSLANAETLGIRAALTGPLLRGDVGTVRAPPRGHDRPRAGRLELYPRGGSPGSGAGRAARRPVQRAARELERRARRGCAACPSRRPVEARRVPGHPFARARRTGTIRRHAARRRRHPSSPFPNPLRAARAAHRHGAPAGPAPRLPDALAGVPPAPSQARLAQPVKALRQAARGPSRADEPRRPDSVGDRRGSPDALDTLPGGGLSGSRIAGSSPWRG